MTGADEFLPYLLRRLDLPGKSSAARLEPLSRSKPSAVQKLTAGDVRYVVRRSASRDGVRDLQREFEILKLLEGSGLAPSPVLLDCDGGFMVCEYLAGVVWSGNMLSEEGALDALTDSLIRLHSYSSMGTVLEPVKRVERYLLDAKPFQRSALTSLCIKAARNLTDTRVALCHFDMWCGNIVQGWSTRFIDWEYADGGNPLVDLATLICYHELEDEQAEMLWRAYSGKTRRPPRHQELAHWCAIVDCLSVAWSLSIASSATDTDFKSQFLLPSLNRLGLDPALWIEKPAT
jgi:aminoglycoside phosphotransferase (APT) family kinase protein